LKEFPIVFVIVIILGLYGKIAKIQSNWPNSIGTFPIHSTLPIQL